MVEALNLLGEMAEQEQVPKLRETIAGLLAERGGNQA